MISCIFCAVSPENETERSKAKPQVNDITYFRRKVIEFRNYRAVLQSDLQVSGGIVAGGGIRMLFNLSERRRDLRSLPPPPDDSGFAAEEDEFYSRAGFAFLWNRKKEEAEEGCRCAVLKPGGKTDGEKYDRFDEVSFRDEKRNVTAGDQRVNHRYNDISVRMPRRYSLRRDDKERKNLCAQREDRGFVMVETFATRRSIIYV